MKLVDLEPRWFDVPGVGGAIDGLSFVCPHCGTQRLAVQFVPMGIDEVVRRAGGNAIALTGKVWGRVGETFETLTLSPSVDASASGHWHGFIQNGTVT